jgi:hypothetical protein
MGGVPILQHNCLSTFNAICIFIVIYRPVYNRYLPSSNVASRKIVIYTQSYPRDIKL